MYKIQLSNSQSRQIEELGTCFRCWYIVVAVSASLLAKYRSVISMKGSIETTLMRLTD